MSNQNEFTTVFRSADASAETEATAARERLEEAGIRAIVLGDDAPGVVEGTWEVRVPLSNQARAEVIVETFPTEPANEDGLTEKGLSHDLDFVSIFSAQGVEAKMEAISIQSVLEANDIPCTVVGSQQIPSLPFEVRVPKFRMREAIRLLQDMRQAVPAKAEGA